MTTVDVTHFTDPACPFAYSAEPQRWRLRWRYGSQLQWTTRVVVLAERRSEQVDKGFTPDLLRQGYASLEQKAGMPFDLSVRKAVPSSLAGCREFVGVRENGDPEAADRLLRELRFEQMARGGCIDELDDLRRASHAAGIESARLDAWSSDSRTVDAVEADKRAARSPEPAALHLPEKLARAGDGYRYTCPSYEFRVDDRLAVVAGFHGPLSYDVALANLAPELDRAEAADDPIEVLRWADAPLATAEVAAIMEIERGEARGRLSDAGATEHALGTDALWTA